MPPPSPPPSPAAKPLASSLASSQPSRSRWPRLRAAGRLAAAIGCAIVLAVATAGAIALYQRSANDHPSGQPARTQYSVNRLHDLRTIMVGSRFPLAYRTCQGYAQRAGKLGLLLPRPNSVDWNRVLAACAAG